MNDCLKTMPCMHRYHSQCIDRWLATDNSCPICKTPIGQDPTFPLAAAPRESLQPQLVRLPTPQQRPRHLNQMSQQFSLSVDDADADDVADELPDRQPATNSRCICNSGRSHCCDAGQFQHNCICQQRTPSKCKSHINHRCICKFGMSAGCRARPLRHDCVCRSGSPTKCKASDHPCLCGSGMTSRCRAGPRTHNCTCSGGTPSTCRSSHHPCVCKSTGTATHCRAEHQRHDCICGGGTLCRCRAGQHVL